MKKEKLICRLKEDFLPICICVLLIIASVGFVWDIISPEPKARQKTELSVENPHVVWLPHIADLASFSYSKLPRIMNVDNTRPTWGTRLIAEDDYVFCFGEGRQEVKVKILQSAWWDHPAKKYRFPSAIYSLPDYPSGLGSWQHYEICDSAGMNYYRAKRTFAFKIGSERQEIDIEFRALED